MRDITNNYSVLIYIRTLLKGGAEKQSLLLQKHLQNEYNSLLIVFYDNVSEEFKRRIKTHNIDVKILEGSILKKLCTLFFIYKKNDIKISFSYLFHDNIIASLYGLIFRVERVYGGYRSSSLRSRVKLFILRVLNNKFFTKTIVNSYSGKTFLETKGFHSNQLLVIQNGIELNKKPIIRRDKKPIILLTVGRFNYLKGYKSALLIFKDVLKMYPEVDIQYHIVGYGPLEKKIHEWIDKMDLKNGSVKVFNNPIHIEPFFLNADIYFSNSITEGLSNSIMEALNYSLPIVATRVGDNSYLVSEGVNGFLSNVEDRATLVENILLLIESPELRVKLGLAGFQHLTNSFGIPFFISRYKKIIDEVMLKK